MTLRMLATQAASVKRAPIVNGKRGEPATVLEGLQCTPLYPADPGEVSNLLQRLKLETPYRMMETFVLGQQDIYGGDTLEIDGRPYLVRAVAPWTLGNATRTFTHLTVEETPTA